MFSHRCGRKLRIDSSRHYEVDESRATDHCTLLSFVFAVTSYPGTRFHSSLMAVADEREQNLTFPPNFISTWCCLSNLTATFIHSSSTRFDAPERCDRKHVN
uniref:Uncharacterized protein n=1 Tax=Panagrellus redivivus TaxID=6233 RepID=A0A7E4VBF3_PANRE